MSTIDGTTLEVSIYDHIYNLYKVTNIRWATKVYEIERLLYKYFFSEISLKKNIIDIKCKDQSYMVANVKIIRIVVSLTTGLNIFTKSILVY